METKKKKGGPSIGPEEEIVSFCPRLISCPLKVKQELSAPGNEELDQIPILFS